MQLADYLAIALLIAAAAAFLLGESALARAEDLHALYWLAVGVTSVRASVLVARPGAKA
jgi:hypothetical protein